MNKFLFNLQNFKTLLLIIFISSLVPFKVSAQKVSVQKYIDTHKERAVQIMEKYDIPASIILGVAIHESAFGNSRLAQYLNNHFGIKGKNDSKEIKSAYKGYESVEESYLDFVRILQDRKQFNHLFYKYDKDDYQNWALGIARGGYASSKTWSAQVIGIIKKYELDKLDQPDSRQDAPSSNRNSYIVKPGDTLSGIASKYNTTVYEIQSTNKLRSTRLQIGQELSL
jgi:flagellum-specific peptidoglycan hydrolase FlgJ